MRIIIDVAYVMAFSVGTAIIAIISSSGDVDDINKTIFAKCVGEVPKCFLVTGRDKIHPFFPVAILVCVVLDADGFSLNFSMKEEFFGDAPVANKDKLAEERPTPLLHIVFYFLKA